MAFPSYRRKPVTSEEFQQIVSQDPALAGPVREGASAIRSQQYDFLTGAAAGALLYAVVRRIIMHVGLPWLSTAVHYSEMWRLKFDRWIDERCRAEGIDPDKAEAAGLALRKELEKIVDPKARASWERLAKQVAESSGEDAA